MSTSFSPEKFPVMMLKCACAVYSGSETIFITSVGAGQQLVIVLVVVNDHPKLLGFKSMRGRPIIRYILSVFSHKHRRTTHVLTLILRNINKVYSL